MAIAAVWSMAKAEVPAIPNSDSPDGNIHAVMDIDRDPKIDPEWKEDSYPRIEITDKATRKILASLRYFGSPGDDARPLREHVVLKWRSDSKAFAITINDRFHSDAGVYVMNQESKFVSVKFPDYKSMTGFPPPSAEHLKPGGRSTVEGWDREGRLIYKIMYSPLASFTGHDPLNHCVFLRVSATGMVPEHVASEKGVWDHGNWVSAEKPEKPMKEGPVPEDGESPSK